MAKTIKFLPGDLVYFNKEKHTVIFIIHPKYLPSNFETEIEEAFTQHTPAMITINGKKYRYQMGGESPFCIKPNKSILYVIAGKPDKKYHTIDIHFATEEQLTKQEEYENAF